MKLWLISQSENSGYDSFDSAVVAAETEEAARNTHPELSYGYYSDIKWSDSIGEWFYNYGDGRIFPSRCYSWTSPDKVSVVFLADGYDGTAGVICTSFNAG